MFRGEVTKALCRNVLSAEESLMGIAEWRGVEDVFSFLFNFLYYSFVL